MANEKEEEKTRTRLEGKGGGKEGKIRTGTQSVLPVCLSLQVHIQGGKDGRTNETTKTETLPDTSAGRRSSRMEKTYNYIRGGEKGPKQGRKQEIGQTQPPPFGHLSHANKA